MNRVAPARRLGTRRLGTRRRVASRLGTRRLGTRRLGTRRLGTRRRAAGAAGVALLAGVAVTGCAAANASSSSIAIPTAYVSQPAKTGGAAEAYLEIRDNGAADTLISASTSVGGRVIFRGPVRTGVAPVPMHDVRDIPVAADALTRLTPVSYHLLIIGAGPMQQGKDITLTLTFAHAGTMTILALVTNPQNGGSSYFLDD
jgi:periplasmic copper chaperone A